MSRSRDQILLDLTERVLSEAIRSVGRLEDDGVDGSEAIRLVRDALANADITEAELARRSLDGRRRSMSRDAPDDRELGGES
jgi:hypothetical protein